MAFTFEQVADNLTELLRKNPNGLGWYAAEMRCSIPRSEFPDGLNVGLALEELVAQGILVKSKVEGKERYFAAGPGQ